MNLVNPIHYNHSSGVLIPEDANFNILRGSISAQSQILSRFKVNMARCHFGESTMTLSLICRFWNELL